jgi:hypothetical protein
MEGGYSVEDDCANVMFSILIENFPPFCFPKKRRARETNRRRGWQQRGDGPGWDEEKMRMCKGVPMCSSFFLSFCLSPFSCPFLVPGLWESLGAIEDQLVQ